LLKRICKLKDLLGGVHESAVFVCPGICLGRKTGHVLFLDVTMERHVLLVVLVAGSLIVSVARCSVPACAKVPVVVLARDRMNQKVWVSMLPPVLDFLAC